jgi:hypothetical protein
LITVSVIMSLPTNPRNDARVMYSCKGTRQDKK